jgi:hypothetical protein
VRFAVLPIVLGQGAPIFSGIDLPALGYRVTEHQASGHATRIVLGSVTRARHPPAARP